MIKFHLLDDDWMERRDFAYMKNLYPMMVKRLLPYIEEECDRLEYRCSMMYDEYPDKLQLILLQRRIVERILKEENIEEQEILEDLVAVLLYQEIYRRRCDDRRTRQKYY